MVFGVLLAPEANCSTNYTKQLEAYLNSFSCKSDCVCSVLEEPSLASACGFSKQPLFMTTVEKLLEKQCDLVDPLSCPSASNRLTGEVCHYQSLTCIVVDDDGDDLGLEY
jgi:hypothetical protein